ncbi:MAG TPA: NfeD family protein [Planctomycetota bacterium]|nr:NfeD family protein [Planctomycetota bacterium]
MGWYFRTISLILAAPLCVNLLAVESDDEPSGKSAWMHAQESGLVAGSFVPSKRGINLKPNAKIMVIPVNDENTNSGMIDEWQVHFIQRRLRHAEREKFDLIVLEITTRGGDVVACKQITDSVAACKVPTIAFVRSYAFSGGAILALGCKGVIVEPHSEMGAAKGFNPNGDLATAVRQKLDGVMRAIMRDLCTVNNYPCALAEAMVDSTMEVVETRGGTRRFMSKEDFDIESKRGATLVKTVKLKDQILTLTGQELVDDGVASGVASSMEELALGMGAPNAQIVRMDISSAESVARFFSNPIWCWLLVIIGLLALFVELAHPGHGIGYAVFAFSMGMFFWLQVFSNNAGLIELILFGVGALLLAFELFVLPTFGALGFVGIAMVIVSIVAAFLPEGMLPGLLGFSGKPSEFMMQQAISGAKWASLTLMTIIAFMGLAWWKGIKLPWSNRFALKTVNSSTIAGGGGSSAALLAVQGGIEPHAGTKLSALTGMSGVAETVLRPAGKVRLEGITYDAISEGGFIEAGVKVIVLRAQGSAVVVRATA